VVPAVPTCPHCQKSGNVPPLVKWSPGAELVKNELKKLIFDQSEVTVVTYGKKVPPKVSSKVPPKVSAEGLFLLAPPYGEKSLPKSLP
jgi:hypothetical protein